MGLEIAFVGLVVVVVCFFIKIGFIVIDSTYENTFPYQLGLVAALLIWQCYIYLLSSSGLLESYAFPPLFVIAFIIPSFIFTGIFLYWHRNKKWIQEIPEVWIVSFQTFRIFVEILFVLGLSAEAYNVEVTIHGYNFDIIFAATAPFIAVLVYRYQLLSRKWVLYWNFLGLAVLASIIVVFQASIYSPAVFGSETPLMPLKGFQYPYILIAGFFMPAAVFLHGFSILQLLKSKRG